MKISDKGIEFLIKEEGGIKLKAYKCQAGIWTIGVGHTGKGVKEGMEITKEKAIELLKGDLRRFENVVNKSIKVTLKQHEFDALISLAFNIGASAFSKSTLVKRINAGSDMKDVEEAWKMWRKGGGKVLPILVRRREREVKMYKGE
ncbi:lysozyme [Fusobacterium sp. HC1336]|uniref:lysozyme n=1 Tax=Fusobacterium sp. HC1336 TaxID=3171169 RepID=UPI003F262829